ncbi:MAG: hypothetical protein KF723_23065 [Rhizobiaceae bacterium]|nr:hypothetical protein [Rhizobiaceae bacterium]
MTPLADIEARRVATGVTVTALERAAGLATRHYYKLLRGVWPATPATLARLELALRRARKGVGPVDRHGELVEIAYRTVLALAARELGADGSKAQVSDPGRRATQDPAWSQAAAARELAVYLLHCGCGLSQTDVGAAAGMTKQAVSTAVKRIEDRADEGSAFAAMVERLTGQIVGEW